MEHPGASAVQSNSQFLKALLLALLALLLSAATLAAAYTLLAPSRDVQLVNIKPEGSASAKTITGGDFKVIFGEASHLSDHVEITRLEGDRALVTRKTLLRAEDYPFISHEIHGKHTGLRILLFWRSSQSPGELFRRRILITGDRAGTINMSNQSGWQGDISEIGIDIYGDLRGKTLAVHQVSALPFSASALLRTLWSQWTAFEVWQLRSINLLPGSPRAALVSHALAAATWAGSALILLGLWFLFSKSSNYLAAIIAISVPWITLDLIWQDRLTTQLAETKFLFQGKTQHERHLADIESDLFSYAHHLKTNALPEPGPRIFLLHDTPKGEIHNYLRLKLQYHLLPHNIYNYGKRPFVRHLLPGDYLLLLDEIEGLKYDAELGALRWHNNSRLAVTPIDQHAMGTLYQIPLESQP